jgi:hypothetical protein
MLLLIVRVRGRAATSLALLALNMIALRLTGSGFGGLKLPDWGLQIGYSINEIS